MKTNIRDYMNKNNLSAVRQSQQNLHNKDSVYDPIKNNGVPYDIVVSSLKYLKSKSECVDQLNKILERVNKQETQIKTRLDTHHIDTIKKFEEDYDLLALQVMKATEAKLKDNKQRFLNELKLRRVDTSEYNTVRRNLDIMRNEIIGLRQGLNREKQYRQYISKIVLKDFELDLHHIQEDIDRVRLPKVDVSFDEKIHSCLKSDLNQIIVMKDDLTSKQFSKLSDNQLSTLNTHINRDLIKRNQPASSSSSRR